MFINRKEEAKDRRAGTETQQLPSYLVLVIVVLVTLLSLSQLSTMLTLHQPIVCHKRIQLRLRVEQPDCTGMHSTVFAPLGLRTFYNIGTASSDT